MRDAVGAAGFLDDNGLPIDADSYDPVLILAALSVDRRLKPADRLAAAREAAKYVHPQLSAIQTTSQVHEEITVRIKGIGGQKDRIVDGRSTKLLAEVPAGQPWQRAEPEE
jgi:hypothetical protein